jgi:hypothetical protein
MAELEAEALRQRRELEAASDKWDQNWSEAFNRLRNFLDRVKTGLHAYDALLSIQSAPEEVSVWLTRAQREALDLQSASEAITWLHRNWPPPGEQVEAAFALWELGLADS